MSIVTADLLKKLQSSTAEEIENSKSNSSEERSKYPIVYLGSNGKLTVRILFNMGLQGIQRKIIRHEVGKSKVACLGIYSEDCPVCNAIKEAEDLRGTEFGARRKYGYKVRGVCYAQVIDFSDKYFDGKEIKKKDIIIMMYPKSVYDKINNLIVDAGENLSKIVCDNEGIPMVIERSQKSSNSIPDYSVSMYPYGSVKSFEDKDCTDGKTPEDMFNDMLSEIPNLAEQFVPVNPNDDIRKETLSAAETILQEAIGDKTVNPSDKSVVNPEKSEDVGGGSIAPSSTEQPGIPNLGSSGDKPDCYKTGYNEGNRKCLSCIYEIECSGVGG